jgi:uncharacterized protein (TIGR03437 family)
MDMKHFESRLGRRRAALTCIALAGLAGVARPLAAQHTVTITLGSVTLDPSDVLYAGAAPGSLISLLNIRIPSGTPAGNQALQIRIGGIASPPGAFLAIAAKQGN